MVLAVTLNVDVLIEGRVPLRFAAFFVEGKIFFSTGFGAFPHAVESLPRTRNIANSAAMRYTQGNNGNGAPL